LRSTNGDLGASDVRLSSVKFEAFVEGDDLSSNKVVSWCEVSGNCPVEFAMAGSKFINTPLLGLLIVTILEDFEPDRSSSSFRFSHVDDARSSMVGSDDIGIRGSKSHFVVELVNHLRARINWAFSVSLLRSSW